MKDPLSWPLLLKRTGGWAHLSAAPRSLVEKFAASVPTKRHAAVRVVRGRDCPTKEALMKEFARALEFPPYFGHNWDALEDCLHDLEWLSSEAFVLLFTNADLMLKQATADWSTLAAILASTASHWASAEPAASFHCVFHCEIASADDLQRRLLASGIETV